MDTYIIIYNATDIIYHMYTFRGYLNIEEKINI